jgi:hypothetical protein
MVREISLLPDSPIKQKDGHWSVLSRKETWDALGAKIFDNHLDRILELAVKILRESDPRFELSPEQRFGASLYGKNRPYSHDLAKGITETLALLGSFPEPLTSCSIGKPDATARLAVRGILKDSDWKLWASVNRYLPMLAEASPEEFLDAVESACAQKPSPFGEVFAQERGGITGENHLTGLLAALETLAWHPDYLTRVIVLLGELTSIDPGGNWSNRPANSAMEILLPWHPQTCANLAKRKAAVVTLVRENPAVAWKLLLALLPKVHEVASGTRKPKWRPFIAVENPEAVTVKEYWEQIDIYADLALDMAGQDISKLQSLIACFSHFPEKARTRLLGVLLSDPILKLKEDEREPLWRELVEFIAEHRRFADTDWAAPSAVVDQLEQVALKLAPNSAAMLLRGLFTDNEIHLHDETVGFEEGQRRLELRRKEAISEIIRSGGLSGALEFTSIVNSPWKVGYSFGQVDAGTSEPSLLPTRLNTAEASMENFIRGYVWARYQTGGYNWIDTLPFERWTIEQIAAVLMLVPFQKETWLRVERLLGASKGEYWKGVNANLYGTQEDLAIAAEELLHFGRPEAAIGCLERMTRSQTQPSSAVVFTALDARFKSVEPFNTRTKGEVIALIKWLQKQPNIDENKLSQIEWNYLGLLDRYFGTVPQTLFRRLANDPIFFCEVIKAVFKSKDANKAEGENTPLEKAIAENGYRLLYEWDLPPGSTADGKFDPQALTRWFAAVVESTSESGHLDIAMNYVGEVLVYTPPEPNGLWINIAAAEILNSKDAETLRSGFVSELFNTRGVHGFTAGEEERKLAHDYRGRAEAVDDAGYQRLATSLRELAISYEHDADRESKRDPYGRS